MVCSSGHYIYNLLAPPDHRMQLRHHVSVIGLTFGLYMNSSSNSIIYAVLVSFSYPFLRVHNHTVVQIVPPSAFFIYHKTGNSTIPTISYNSYLHTQEKFRFAYKVILWILWTSTWANEVQKGGKNMARETRNVSETETFRQLFVTVFDIHRLFSQRKSETLPEYYNCSKLPGL